MPLQYNSFPFIAIADQIDSALTNAIANQRASYHRLRQANHCFSFALRHFAVLCLCSSLPGIAPLCHRTTYRCCSLPLLCFISPRHAFAARLKSHHCHAIPLRVYAFCTLPLPFFAPPTPALPLPCNAKPLRRILRCSALFWSSKYGPYLSVPPRPGVAASARRCRRC